MRCTVTETVAKFPTTNATASTQKTGIRAAAPRVRLAAAGRAAAPGSGAGSAGARRSTSAWSGIVTAPSTRARSVIAVRQPSRARSHDSMGMKIVLARPAASVSVSRARSRPRAANQATRAANAGS